MKQRTWRLSGSSSRSAPAGRKGVPLLEAKSEIEGKISRPGPSQDLGRRGEGAAAGACCGGRGEERVRRFEGDRKGLARVLVGQAGTDQGATGTAPRREGPQPWRGLSLCPLPCRWTGSLRLSRDWRRATSQRGASTSPPQKRSCWGKEEPTPFFGLRSFRGSQARLSKAAYNYRTRSGGLVPERPAAAGLMTLNVTHRSARERDIIPPQLPMTSATDRGVLRSRQRT